MIGSDSYNGQYRLCILLNCIGIRRPSVFLIGCCEMAALICWISCKQRLMGDMRLVNVPLERKTNVFPQRSSLHSTRLGLRHTHELEDRNHDKAALYSWGHPNIRDTSTAGILRGERGRTNAGPTYDTTRCIHGTPRHPLEQTQYVRRPSHEHFTTLLLLRSLAIVVRAPRDETGLERLPNLPLHPWILNDMGPVMPRPLIRLE
jgi:hypothetical protein